MKKSVNTKLPYFALKKKPKVQGKSDSRYDQLKQTARKSYKKYLKKKRSERLLMQDSSTKESVNKNVRF